MLKILRKLMKNTYRQIQEGDIFFNELKEKVNKGAILLDVRSPQEYEEGHLDGAILIPDYECKSRINEIEKYKNSTVIVYCRSGSRSRKVYKFLKENNFKDVYNLYGGLERVL